MTPTATAMPVSRHPPAIQEIRKMTPFVNFVDPSSHAKTSPSVRLMPSAPPNSVWITSRGYGSRHVNDVAPFTLWDEGELDFRSPTALERLWIINYYGATCVSYDYPTMTIWTPTPPNPVSLTAGCTAVIFVPPDFKEIPMMGNTVYANPRLPDPVQSISLSRRQNPSRDEVTAVLKALCRVANVHAVNFLSPFIFVELCSNDGRSYDRHSLPGRVAGHATIYHHGGTPF
ncbi:MAG: hypothetical protein M1840_004926 [Geoglossum simile]|nr:MAG: hypothetical protein M1840_004926 [Geoglossum simile]